MPGLLSVSALSVSPAVNLSNNKINSTYPNVQNVGNNVYVAWSESSHGIWFRMSSNAGSTFGKAIEISPTTGVAQFPLIVALGTDVYVTWAQTISTGVLQIFFAASTNSGGSFSPAKVVDNTPTGTDITPVLAAAGNDVYVAYDASGSSAVVSSTNNGGTFGTPFIYATGPEPQIAASGSNVYAVADSFSRKAMPVAVSNNAGGTWKITDISGGSGAEPWISASGTNVIVAWETKGTGSIVGLATSTNSGATFTKAFTLSTTTPDAWAPMTGISGNTEYVAYRTNPGSVRSQEYAAVSLNAGGTWSTPVAIGIAGHDNSWPVTIPTNGGTAFVAWYVTSGTSLSTPWEAAVVETTNSGTSWSAPVILGGSLGESDVATQAISSNNGVMFAVWANTVSGIDQVFFTSGS
jgi:hypothetical protein